jgi:hypothetical protein
MAVPAALVATALVVGGADVLMNLHHSGIVTTDTTHVHSFGRTGCKTLTVTFRVEVTVFVPELLAAFGLPSRNDR